MLPVDPTAASLPIGASPVSSPHRADAEADAQVCLCALSKGTCRQVFPSPGARLCGVPPRLHLSTKLQWTTGGNGAFTSIGDHRGMAIDFTAQTESAALAARDRLDVLAKAPARDERSAARIAKSALFEEALLG